MAVSTEIVPLIEGLARDRVALQVEANLQLEIDGVQLAVSSRGDRLLIRVPSVQASLGLLRSGSGQLLTMAGMLDGAGVTAELLTGDAVLAVIGADAAPGPVESSLLEGPVELRPGGVLAGLLRFR